MDKYSGIRLECAENGYILSYQECVKTGTNPMANCSYNSCSRIYKENEGAQALKDMKEMYESGEDDKNDKY